MAKFLTTAGNSYQIEQIIVNAEKSLTLVTPFLSLSENLVDRLSDANKNGVKITLIYGKKKLIGFERKKIEHLENLEIFFCKNLHAKCYHNESQLIITSMNLYQFSERNNREMGILFEINFDKKIFRETLKEIESIKNSSELEKSAQNIKVFNNSASKIQLHPKYTEEFNFHLPSLYNLLKEKYSQYSIYFGDSILIENFPNRGINLNVGRSIDFNFSDNEYYLLAKEKVCESLNKKLLKIRIYWNYNRINIYEEKDFQVDINESGLKTKSNKWMQIIDIVYEELKDVN